MPSITSQTKTTDMNRLPLALFLHILERLPIKDKFVLKAVSKKWHTFLTYHILPKQHKLSIEEDYFCPCKCIHPDHQFNFHGNNSIPLVPVRASRNRRRFFEEVTGVKVLKFGGDRDAYQVVTYYLSEGPSSSLECLDIPSLEKPLVKVFPNLQHFSAESINLVSLISVLEYCPVLTHLSIDIRHFSGDFVDTLMNLPRGLQYLKLGRRSCDSLAVFCSPAMETLETVLLDNWSSPVLFNKRDARVKPAPLLRRFSMSSNLDKKEDRKMVVDLMKECPALKNIYLRVTGLTLEDYVNIYSGLSNLEMIHLALKFQFDDVIDMILEKNKNSLKHLYIGRLLLNLESLKKLAEFPNLQTLSFCSDLPSDEQLLVFVQRRREVCQSPLRLKCHVWSVNHFLDPLGPALRDANVELVPYGKYPSVMD